MKLVQVYHVKEYIKRVDDLITQAILSHQDCKIINCKYPSSLNLTAGTSTQNREGEDFDNI